MNSRELCKDEYPQWAGPINGLVHAVSEGIITPEQAVASTHRTVKELYKSRLLMDIGEVQQYLRDRKAPIQLLAVPFRPEDMPSPDIGCVDILTRERRGHYLQVAIVQHTPAAPYDEQYAANDRSHIFNEYDLSHDTGVLETCVLSV